MFMLMPNSVVWRLWLSAVIVWSLASWIWELLILRLAAQANVYPTLMPSEGSEDLYWSTSVAVADTTDVSIAKEIHWWVSLLLMGFGTCVCGCLWRRVATLFLDSLRDAAPVAGRKMSATKALNVISDEASQRIALGNCALVNSPIREVEGPLSRKTHAMAGVHPAATVIASSTTIDTRAKGLRHNLTLSRITSTVDISPLLPGQIDNKAMDQLSELLQSW